MTDTERVLEKLNKLEGQAGSNHMWMSLNLVVVMLTLGILSGRLSGEHLGRHMTNTVQERAALHTYQCQCAAR